MEFIIWHYTEGINYYIARWNFYVRWIIHYFSLTTLLGTLFEPWKRLIEVDKSPGFNIQKYFETMMFNMISRGIGFAVRFTLFWVGLIVLIFVFFGGALGIIVWLALPFLGYPVYSRLNNTPENYIQSLIYSMKTDKREALEVFSESEAGKFFISHIGLTKEEFVRNTKLKSEFADKTKAKTLEAITQKLLEQGAWQEDFLKKKGLDKKDLTLASKWFDDIKKEESDITGEEVFGRPGIGLELVYGYTPTLNQFSIDLSAPQAFSHRLIGRQNVVSQMERALTAGNSIVLVGQPGVGKKTVVLEFAHRAANGKLGAKMAYRRVLEFDYNSLLSESIDLNQKKTKLAQVLAEASYAGNIILMLRDIHRLTNPEVEGYDFTDVFEEYMEGEELKIIAVATPRDYERFISQNLRLRKFLKEVEVEPPSKEEALEILIDSAKNWETKKDIAIPVPVLRKILEESDRYITEVPFPEKALELLDSVIFYREQKGGGKITINDTNVVLAEKTGVSFAHLTTSEKKRLGNIEEIIHERLVDQESAVNLIAKSLRGRSVGAKKENRPIGSFLFMGPTGVGKTQTAKVLAKVYYGSQEAIIRFDMAEYSGKEGLERLIGSTTKNQPGALTTEIKNKPASLLLLDEIEKAPPEIYNLFLTLLDEGSITDAFGRKIDARHLFVIATSNAGAEYIRQLVGKGVKGGELQEKLVNHVLEKQIYSPEFLNRFDGVVVYEPLREEDLVKIAKLLLKELAERLKRKNIELVVTDELAQKVAKEGYDPAFGARPMNRVIDLVLGDIIGKSMLKDQIGSGDKFRIPTGPGKEEYSIEKLSKT